jgi:hypothetical protein
MSEFKVGDIVRIVKRFELGPDVVDHVGFIDELGHRCATVQLLCLDGSPSGLGSIPLDCLELETSERWTRAKARHDEVSAARSRAHNARLQRWHQHVAKVAERYCVSVDTATAIRNELDAFEQEP